jgi:hypothetical protein
MDARARWGALSLAALAIALLAKESAFTGIALVPVLHHQSDARAAVWQRIRVVVRTYCSVLRTGVAYPGGRLVGTAGSTGSLDNPLAHVSPFVRIATAVVVLWQYVALLIVPTQLAADYFLQTGPVGSVGERRPVAACSGRIGDDREPAGVERITDSWSGSGRLLCPHPAGTDREPAVPDRNDQGRTAAVFAVARRLLRGGGTAHADSAALAPHVSGSAAPHRGDVRAAHVESQ